MIVIQLYCVVLCGFLDRVRGDTFDFVNKSLEAFLYGMAVAICAGSPDHWTYPVFAILWAAGASFGWGEPIGAALSGRGMYHEKFEWWQFSIFKKNVWAALCLRGFLWGVPTLPLAWVDPRYLIVLCMTFVFPLAVLFDKRFAIFGGMWEEQELVRGWMIGLIAFFSSFVNNTAPL